MCLSDASVRLAREEQRHVDLDARGEELADGRERLGRPRDLDDVLAAERLPQAPRLGRGRAGVPGRRARRSATGLAIAWQLASRFGWPVLFRPDVVLVAVGFSGLVGVGFGLYPARRASLLDPIQALRID